MPGLRRARAAVSSGSSVGREHGVVPDEDLPTAPAEPPSPEETAASFSDALRADRFRRELRTDARDRDTVAMHAWVYGAINLMLVALWAVLWSAGGTAAPWFLVPLVGWGAVLATHASTARRRR